jgi:hypothetical protein
MIPVSRTVAKNILINKHIIKALPRIDSNNKDHIEAIAGNELRVLKRYAVAYDFIANLIHKAHKLNIIHEWIEDTGRDYFKGTVKETTWREYFKDCGDFKIRQSLARQIKRDLHSGFIYIHGHDKKKGEYIEYRRPFFVTAIRQFENGERERDLFFSKTVFNSLVTGECFKNGGDGFIEIPASLYPKLTHTETGKIQSHNPIYKINVFGLLKNTHKKKKIIVKKYDFIENVIPEYARKDDIWGGYYLKTPEYVIHGALIESIKQSNKLCPQDRIISNFYIGPEDVTLYFSL